MDLMETQMTHLPPELAAALIAQSAPASPAPPLSQADLDWARDKFGDDFEPRRESDEDYYGTRDYR